MFSRTRVAAKYFTYGLIIGLLFAPGNGEQNRERLKNWITDMLDQIRP